MLLANQMPPPDVSEMARRFAGTAHRVPYEGAPRNGLRKVGEVELADALDFIAGGEFNEVGKLEMVHLAVSVRDAHSTKVVVQAPLAINTRTL